MGIFHYASEAGSVALIIASWASELFLAALFLRVVVLPSVTQTNARIWTMLSSSTDVKDLVVVENACDRMVDSWVIRPAQEWARKLRARRDLTLETCRDMLLQAENEGRKVKDRLRSIRSAKHPRSAPPKELSIDSQILLDAWSVLFQAIEVFTLLLETPMRGLMLTRHPQSDTTTPTAEQNEPTTTEPMQDPDLSLSSRTDGSTFTLLPIGRRAAMFLTPRHDPRLAKPGPRSILKFPSGKSRTKRPSLKIATEWHPKDLEPEYWRRSPLRQGMGFFQRRIGIHSPRYRRAVLLNRLRPSSIGSPLREKRKGHLKDEPGTPIRSRYSSPVSQQPQRLQTDAPERTTSSEQSKATQQSKVHSPVQEVEWLSAMREHLSTPAPAILDRDQRNPQRVLTALHLHQLQEMLVMIHHDYIELSDDHGTRTLNPGPENPDYRQIWFMKDLFQTAAEFLSTFGNAEDIRGFNGSFFTSLIGLLDSEILHLHSALAIFDYDPVFKGLCERAISAAQSVSNGLATVRAVATLQRAQGGFAQEVVEGELITIGEV